MELDSLFLSGGGVNCIAFLGAFLYMFQNEILKPNLEGIKNVVCVSGSSIVMLPFILGFSYEVTLKLFLETDYNKLIDYNHFDLNDLFLNYGLYNNNFIDIMCGTVLKNKKLSERITLKELYKKTKINFVLKTSNLSDYSIVYLSYKTHPDLPVIDAIKMTTCIPLIFQPIKYKDDLYVDGGLCGNYPLEYNRILKSKKFLGIHVKCIDNKKEITDIFSYLNRIHMAPLSPYDNIHSKRKNTILIKVDEKGIIFSRTDEQKKKIIKIGYISTKEYFNSLEPPL